MEVEEEEEELEKTMRRKVLRWVATSGTRLDHLSLAAFMPRDHAIDYNFVMLCGRTHDELHEEIARGCGDEWLTPVRVARLLAPLTTVGFTGDSYGLDWLTTPNETLGRVLSRSPGDAKILATRSSTPPGSPPPASSSPCSGSRCLSRSISCPTSLRPLSWSTTGASSRRGPRRRRTKSQQRAMRRQSRAKRRRCGAARRAPTRRMWRASVCSGASAAIRNTFSNAVIRSPLCTSCSAPCSNSM